MKFIHGTLLPGKKSYINAILKKNFDTTLIIRYSIGTVQLMLKPSPVSIADVAKRANVSKSSVSLVLNTRNGRIPLSEESIQRVREAIRELGYQPNVFARGLASGRSRLRSLAVVIANDHVLSGHVVSRVLAGLTEAAAERGYSCTLLSPRSEPGSAFTDHPIFKERLVEGVVALAWEKIFQACFDEVRNQGLPFVAVHMEPAEESIPYVTSDDFGNSYKTTEHLYQLGHRKFAFVGGPPNGDAANQRIAGFTRYLVEHDLAVPSDCIVRGDYQSVERTAFEKLMNGPHRPTAIVAVSDPVAARLIRWSKVLRIGIPSDLAIAGFDDDPLSEFLDPPLTTVRSTAFHQGELVAEMVLDMIAGTQPRRKRISLPGELIIRESTLSK